ncbi:hypothetical protein P7K49_032299, partial [Saguinus oedipus]
EYFKSSRRKDLKVERVKCKSVESLHNVIQHSTVAGSCPPSAALAQNGMKPTVSDQHHLRRPLDAPPAPMCGICPVKGGDKALLQHLRKLRRKDSARAECATEHRIGPETGLANVNAKMRNTSVTNSEHLIPDRLKLMQENTSDQTPQSTANRQALAFQSPQTNHR